MADIVQPVMAKKSKGWKLPLFLGGYQLSGRTAKILLAGYAVKTAAFAWAWKTYPILKMSIVKIGGLVLFTTIGVIEAVFDRPPQ